MCRKELITAVLLELEALKIGSTWQILTIGTAGTEVATMLSGAASALLA